MARGQDDQLEYVAVGEEILADHYNRLVDIVRRVSDGEEYYADGIGITYLPPVSESAFGVRIGKLDGALSVLGSATVSLWCGLTADDDHWSGWHHDSGENITAYATPMFHEAVDSGTWVMVIKSYSRWLVIDYCCEIVDPTYC